jgi:hypothetical protein
LAAFRGGRILFSALVCNVVDGGELYDVQYVDGTIELGVLPSLLFRSIEEANRADPSLREERSDLVVCGICRIQDGRDVLECGFCGLYVHEKCYNVLNDPEDEEDWICARCATLPKKAKRAEKRELVSRFSCALCPKVGSGLFVELALPPSVHSSIPRWAHWHCAAWLPGLSITVRSQVHGRIGLHTLSSTL